MDGCRVSGEGYTNGGKNNSVAFGRDMEPQERCDGGRGRFPANVITDGSEEVVKMFPTSKDGVAVLRTGKSASSIWGSGNTEKAPDMGYGGSGSACRFFYSAKASGEDRNEGLEGFEERQQDESRKEGNPGGDNPRNRGVHVRANNHPTVKPVDLMCYLCRLITPKGGTVLDPFMGSGSTGKAAQMEGFNFIGIELDPEYMKIAKARIGYADNLFTPKEVKHGEHYLYN